MTERVTVTDVHFAEASDGHQRLGLLGWISVTLAGVVRIDGIALRRSRRGGELLLSWPARRDRTGVQHTIVLPVLVYRDEVNRQILDQVRAILESVDRRDVKARESAP